MRLMNPYLMFDGSCAEAFAFYHQVLGGNLEAMLRYGEMPDCGDMPADIADRVAHARLAVDGEVLMGSDCQPGKATRQEGVSIHLGIDDPDEAGRVFDALADGGNVEMPLEETFWAQRFGVCTDRFGTSWMVNCEKPQTAMGDA